MSRVLVKHHNSYPERQQLSQFNLGRKNIYEIIQPIETQPKRSTRHMQACAISVCECRLL